VVVQGGTESPQGEEVVTPFLKKKGDDKTVSYSPLVSQQRGGKNSRLESQQGSLRPGQDAPFFIF